METIFISVVFKFTIKDFPLSLYEIFLVIRPVVNKLGELLAIEFIKRLGKSADQLLKNKGCVHHSYQKRTFQGVLGKIPLRLLKVKSPAGSIQYALAERVKLPAPLMETLRV